MFYVGQKVVCVSHDGWRTSLAGEFYPDVGGIYTIRDLTDGPMGKELCLQLVEIVNPKRHYRNGFTELEFGRKYFRPVTDISTLQAIVAEVKTGKPRKIKADRFDKVRV